jgi:carbon-monoxide dehydrogenase small subunit
MSGRTYVSATINGESIDFLCEPRQSLLEALRDELQMTGTKEGCNNGNCGACNVIMNGALVNACCVLAVEANGARIETIEGVANGEELHPLQQSFLQEAALQCGICTPGFIVAAKALLDKEPDADEARIRHWLAGNLCRCTGYDKIVHAVLDAAEVMRRQPVGS